MRAEFDRGEERKMRLGMLLLYMLVFAGCDVHDYTPTAHEVASPNSPTISFHVEPQDFEGLYGNIDVTSSLYSYVTKCTSEEQFWQKIDEQAEESEWRLIQDKGNQRWYQRTVRSAGGQQPLLFEARVSLDESQERVIIGWVECGPDASLGKPNVRQRFAHEKLWPKFESYYNTTNGTH